MRRFCFALLLFIAGLSFAPATRAQGFGLVGVPQDSTSVTNVSTVKVRGRASVPSRSTIGNAVFYFDKTSGRLKVSENGGAFGTFGGGAGGASAALDNLASVSINTSLTPQSGVNLGASAAPFKNLWIYGQGTFGSHSIEFDGAPTGHRTVTFPDSNTTLPIAAQQLTFSGPTAARTVLLPDASFTVARTDAGQTFVGVNTFTSPKILTDISDTNGSELFKFTATASAVNEFTVTNAATGNSPTFNASGDDTDVGLTMMVKGNAKTFVIKSSASGGYSNLILDVQESSGASLFEIQRGSGSIRVNVPSAQIATYGTNDILSDNLGLRLHSNNLVGWSNSGAAYNANDLWIRRGGAANLALGAPDAAAPVSQKLSVQNVVAGISNTAGANWTFRGSAGTGTGAGGSLIWEVAPAGTSGTSQNSFVTALTIDSTKAAILEGIPRFNGTNTAGAGTALLGSNSPATTLNAPYTWIQVTSADGSTVYIPAWK